MGSVDRLTLVELIEAQKAKLSPEAPELWEELDASIYLSPEEETRLKLHEIAIMERMAELPADKPILDILTDPRAGLYQSDYLDERGEPSQHHRDRCVISASLTKDRGGRGPGKPFPVEELRNRTVDRALTRLREE